MPNLSIPPKLSHFNLCVTAQATLWKHLITKTPNDPASFAPFFSEETQSLPNGHLYIPAGHRLTYILRMYVYMCIF